MEWILRAVVENPSESDTQHMDELTQGYSAAAFASLRSQLKAAEDQLHGTNRGHHPDHVPGLRLTPAVAQTLQAMVNCTRRSLMPGVRISPRKTARPGKWTSASSNRSASADTSLISTSLTRRSHSSGLASC